MLRAVILGAVLGPLACEALVSAGPPKATNATRETVSANPGTITGETVTIALEKELVGDNAARLSLLRERLSGSPDDAAAHWHLGEVQVGEEWVPYERVADHGNRWRGLYRYREERSRKGATVDDQLFLADGARAHHLFDEERAHLSQVVALNAFHQEANERLGNVLVNSQWISRESVERSMSAQSRWNRTLATYGPEAARRVQAWRKLSEKKFAQIADPFADWGDPERLFALEQAVGDSGDVVHRAYLKWLGTLDCYEATIAIARQAIFSEEAEVRLEAMHALKSRSPEDYLQQLVGSIRKYQAAETKGPSSSQGGHTAAFQWEDMDTVWSAHLTLRQPVHVIDFLPARRRGRRGVTRVVIPQNNYLESRLALAVDFCRLEAEHLAATAEFRNSRVFRTLSVAFDRTIDEPQEAWDLWREVADTGLMRQRLSWNYEEGWYVDQRQRIRRGPATPVVYSRVTIGAGSCLVAGTPIVTETGPQAVESIMPGDRVLTQDPETGELVFQPVLARTQREKAKLFRLKTADNEITCSQGHPFWVNGLGWVQARALEVGMPLHTVLGSTEVTSIESAGEGTVHNLVVADAHTYFIGKTNAYLSHDVTRRQPTNALIPGLQPVWQTPASEEDRPITAR